MYRFLRCNTDTRIPTLEGWYLEVKRGDFATMIDLQLAITTAYFLRFKLDPHIDPQGPLNPVRLADRWVKSLHDLLTKDKVILVNSCGGFLPLTNIKILSWIETDKLRWPDIYEDEIITISRWPRGKHYYLSSNHNRIFVPSKFSTYTGAKELATVYVNESKIKSNE